MQSKEGVLGFFFCMLHFLDCLNLFFCCETETILKGRSDEESCVSTEVSWDLRERQPRQPRISKPTGHRAHAWLCFTASVYTDSRRPTPQRINFANHFSRHSCSAFSNSALTLTNTTGTKSSSTRLTSKELA